MNYERMGKCKKILHISIKIQKICSKTENDLNPDKFSEGIFWD